MTQPAASPSPTPAGAFDEGEDRSALLAAREQMIAHVRAQAEAAAAPVARRPQGAMIAAAVVLAGAAAYLWFGNPAWLQPSPGSIAEPSTTQMERVLRGVAPMIDAVIAARGEAPNTLAAVGLSDRMYEYAKHGPTSYSLSLRSHTTVVTLDVTADPKTPIERRVHSQRITP